MVRKNTSTKLKSYLGFRYRYVKKYNKWIALENRGRLSATIRFDTEKEMVQYCAEQRPYLKRKAA